MQFFRPAPSRRLRRLAPLASPAVALGLAALLTGCGGGRPAADAARPVPVLGDAARAAATTAGPVATAGGGEAVIRANLQKYIKGIPPVDEVKVSEIPGVWEVRIGNDILYTDATGQHLIKGDIIDLATRRNLTNEKVTALTAVDFSKLPLQDAIVWKNGAGTRKVAVFADPNCGYCKHFEQGLGSLPDITVYTFLYPVLGDDSHVKAQAIWCAQNRAGVWNGWMRDSQPIPPAAACDTSVLERNLEFGRAHRINGTPALFFVDGVRVPGVMSPDQLEARLHEAGKKAG